MQRLIILHTNDIHGRVEGLARVATLVARIRADNPGTPVLYFDCGDSEESLVRVSSITKGVAMHRLLSAAGCDAATVGNAAAQRYGPEVLRGHAAAASYPLILANIRAPNGTSLAGVRRRHVLDAGRLRLGITGVTSVEFGYYDAFEVETRSPIPVVREELRALHLERARAVVVLSHLGLARDRELAAAVPDLPLILGAHSHDLLTQGERVGGVAIAQAGDSAEHLGRVDLMWDGEHLRVERVRVLPVGADVPPHPAVLGEVERIEEDVRGFLDVPIGELSSPLDFAVDRECALGNMLADAVCDRMGADIGLVAVGQAVTGPLPAGPLRRGALWEICHSTANPGVAALTGAQVVQLVRVGLDPVYALQTHRILRGQLRGLVHVSGAQVRNRELLVAEEPVQSEREYAVAATDWEFEPYGGYADERWGLQPRYDMPTILREAVEEYVRVHSPLSGEVGRLG